MQIVVKANDTQWEELTSTCPGNIFIRADDIGSFSAHAAADVFLNFDEDAGTKNYSSVPKPVLINSVVDTLKENDLPVNVLRFNGWSSFIGRPIWEIAGHANEDTLAMIAGLGKKMTVVKDEPGLIAARVVSMIINEAYFALGEEVSNKAAIDIAMKLGTNYPYGPFEWAEKIGVENIHHLLKKLSKTDDRCKPALLLEKEALEKHGPHPKY